MARPERVVEHGLAQVCDELVRRHRLVGYVEVHGLPDGVRGQVGRHDRSVA